jgi:2,3-dimethylmalate lyase
LGARWKAILGEVGPPVVLRQRLGQSRIVVAPGAADALTARIIEEAGFEAVYVTGAGIANASLAVADVGLTTLPELVSTIQRICDAVAIPVIADADTGYGGPLNIMRTVRELERAGVAAIQLEDQVSPKRCGHFDDKRVVPCEEMVQRISAALDARRSGDVQIIARTDARDCEGFDRAIERAHAYAAAGADVIFVEAPLSVAEFHSIPSLIHTRTMANMVEGGKSPLLSAAELEAMGFSLVIFPNTALRVAVKSVQDAMAQLRRDGTSQALMDRMITWQERQRLVRLGELQTTERRYLAPS